MPSQICRAHPHPLKHLPCDPGTPAACFTAKSREPWRPWGSESGDTCFQVSPRGERLCFLGTSRAPGSCWLSPSDPVSVHSLRWVVCYSGPGCAVPGHCPGSRLETGHCPLQALWLRLRPLERAGQWRPALGIFWDASLLFTAKMVRVNEPWPDKCFERGSASS